MPQPHLDPRLLPPAGARTPNTDRPPTDPVADRARRRQSKMEGGLDALNAAAPGGQPLARAARAGRVEQAIAEVRAAGKHVEEIDGGARRFVAVGPAVYDEAGFLGYHAQLVSLDGWDAKRVEALVNTFFSWFADNYVVYGYANRVGHKLDAAPQRDLVAGASKRVVDGTQGVHVMADLMGLVMCALSVGDLPALLLRGAGQLGKRLAVSTPKAPPAWARDLLAHALVSATVHARFFQSQDAPPAIRRALRDAASAAARQL